MKKNVSNLRIAITSDHAGFELKQKIRTNLESNGIGVTDLGPKNIEPVDYPDYGKAIANQILEGKADKGIALCGTGIGISISANRFKGIRAALCHNSETAKQARKHNNANIIAIGARHINFENAIACINTFLETEFEGNRHNRRINKLDDEIPKIKETDLEDKELSDALADELDRQQNTVELIASENFASSNILYYQGSVLTNKYAEGYPGKRYYGGCEFVDVIENLAIERLKSLFSCNWANVQPNSGSQANQAVYLALLSPGDTILGMSLSAGGHLTHGAAPNQSGKYFKSYTYGVRKNDGIIDYEEVRTLAKKYKPKLIIAGASAYSAKIDFKIFREISDEVNAYLLVDMAHYSGLIASGCYPNPLDFADVCTSTTHKTLRGPRGGIILTNDEELAKKFNSAIFPGLQGGPLMHVIAAKAVAFGEALKPDFKTYQENVIENAKVLSKTLEERGFRIVTGGTDTHVVLVDVGSKNIKGNEAEKSLGNANITCNKNGIPFDTEKPMVTSGIRLGTPAGTTRGFGRDDFMNIGNWIADVLEELQINGIDNNHKAELLIKNKVLDLCKNYPIY